MPLLSVAHPRDAADRTWLLELWGRAWSDTFMVSRGRIYRLEDVEARIAWLDGERVGAVTFHIGAAADGRLECEVVSLNSLREGQGVGSRLLAAAEEAALQAGCRRIWLTTTNDNTRALRFYQRQGYRLVALYPGAMDEARKLKPAIPLVGNDGIPIRDEIELEKALPVTG